MIASIRNKTNRIVSIALAALLIAATSALTLLFPTGFIESFLKPYNKVEIEDIEADLDHIRRMVFKRAARVQTSDLIYLASAGAPLSRKSTTLEYYLANNPRFSKLAYIDPDTRALFFMSTYVESLSYLNLTRYDAMVKAKKAAYEKWRAASNYISSKLLDEAFTPDEEGKRISIAHGTTLSGDAVESMLSKLKDAGYRIELILCAADEDVRLQAYDYRNNEQKIVQVTPEDMINKANLFVDRVPVHFAYAHKIYIHYANTISDDYEPAAIIDFSEKTLLIKDAKKYQNFVANYAKRAKKGAPKWATLVKGLTKTQNPS